MPHRPFLELPSKGNPMLSNLESPAPRLTIETFVRQPAETATAPEHVEVALRVKNLNLY